MKKKILSVLLALALVLIGTAGMAANTVAANDDETLAFSAPVMYNNINLGYYFHIVYWEWDYTYVIDWDVSYYAPQIAQGQYKARLLSINQDSQNYVNRVVCTSDALYEIYYADDYDWSDRLATKLVTVETVHYADGTYARIS
jgi:hypothetical protein